MNYFDEKREKTKAVTVSELVKERLLQQIDRQEETVKTLENTTAEKYVDTLRIIDLLREWQSYVAVLPECAHSDAILEKAEQLLKEAADRI